MRISHEDVPHCFVANQSFNDLASGLVQDILQTEGDGAIQYIACETAAETARHWDLQRPSDLVSHPYVEKNSQGPPVSFPNAFGEYERLVASCIAWGTYSTYVLTGEMGSGKSSTLRFLRAALSDQRNRQCHACQVCRPVSLLLDFNRGFGQRTPGKLLRAFHRRLAGMLRRETKDIFIASDLSDSFYISLRQAGGDWEGFGRFVDLVDSDLDWPTRSARDKTALLFRTIDDAEGDVEQCELLVQLLAHIRATHRPHAACLFVLYDNIDSILPEVQYDILCEILRLQTFAKVKSVLSPVFWT